MSEESPPEAVRELAEACVGYVLGAVGVPLDYTPDTLPLLDHYLRTVPENAAGEVLALIAPAAGAYFGEVVRRTIGLTHGRVVGLPVHRARLAEERQRGPTARARRRDRGLQLRVPAGLTRHPWSP